MNERKITKRIDESFPVNLIKKGILILDSSGQIWRQYILRGHDKKLVKIKKRKIGFTTENGYIRIAVLHNKKHHYFWAHRIIWVYHNGRIPEGKVINHIDGKKANNRIENLQAVTYSENIIHSLKYKLRVNKLTSKDVNEIKYLINMGYSADFICERYNIGKRHLSGIKNGKSWSYVK